MNCSAFIRVIAGAVSILASFRFDRCMAEATSQAYAKVGLEE
jgi:hypothetical protein